jgi:uncharacterized coiled-coil DUF342 family protein
MRRVDDKQLDAIRRRTELVGSDPVGDEADRADLLAEVDRLNHRLVVVTEQRDHYRDAAARARTDWGAELAEVRDEADRLASLVSEQAAALAEERALREETRQVFGILQHRMDDFAYDELAHLINERAALAGEQR